MRLIGIFALCIFTTAAFADQCAWNKLTDSQSAKQLLTNNDAIFWCQNCNESPSKIFKIQSVRTNRTTGELTATVAGKTEKLNLDLAYVYVRTASDIFANVAHLVGCEGNRANGAEGAITFIKTGPGVKKEAHYYDGRGQRHALTSALNEDIRPWVSMTYKETPSDRMPASK